jgi:hypothetical protein
LPEFVVEGRVKIMRRCMFVILTMLLALSAVASASGTKKKFVAQVNSDSGCPTGISLADPKNASLSRVCVDGYPPAALSDVRPYLGATVSVEGVVYANSSITLKKVAKKKVYDPCALGATSFIAALGQGWLVCLRLQPFHRVAGQPSMQMPRCGLANPHLHLRRQPQPPLQIMLVLHLVSSMAYHSALERVTNPAIFGS